MTLLACRTDRLRVNAMEGNSKARLLDFRPVLTNALELRPGANIRGGSVAQDFQLDKRLVRDCARQWRVGEEGVSMVHDVQPNW